MKNSAINRCHHTFNPWVGCPRISPGYVNCYAESQNKFHKWNGGEWGPGAPRKITSEANWQQPIRRNEEATATALSVAIRATFDIDARQSGFAKNLTQKQAADEIIIRHELIGNQLQLVSSRFERSKLIRRYHDLYAPLSLFKEFIAAIGASSILQAVNPGDISEFRRETLAEIELTSLCCT